MSQQKQDSGEQLMEPKQLQTKNYVGVYAARSYPKTQLHQINLKTKFPFQPFSTFQPGPLRKVCPLQSGLSFCSHCFS